MVYIRVGIRFGGRFQTHTRETGNEELKLDHFYPQAITNGSMDMQNSSNKYFQNNIFKNKIRDRIYKMSLQD